MLTTVFAWFQNLRWSDGIDIALLWFLLYRILLLLRGTRAIQSLLGLLVVFLIFVVSARFQLYALHWMLEKFFAFIVLAVVILFQSDIRRGLATAGMRLFPSFKGKPDTGATEEIIRASFQMATRRIGALIAIEREASLDDYADSGQRIDARVLTDLLFSIFHPTSPLHDGAVVVQQGRLVAAKVFLPLSLSRDVSRFYGTRHRAAIGLTEETDAVVIIVSEERGTVGVVVAGEVIPVADANELRLRLLDFFRIDSRRAPAGGQS
ncbi:MAG: TIGR00159 family protein [Myxococcales bacterium]|nr:TIGR00159 family protein [Myxococcales bacterium]